MTVGVAISPRLSAFRSQIPDSPNWYHSPVGPVWRLIKGQKDLCHRCGKEIVDFPAVGRVVDFQFRADEKYCWDCYRYLSPFLDDIDPETQDPYQPVTKPAIP